MPRYWIHFAWILSLFFQKWSEFQNFISQRNSEFLSSKCLSEWWGNIKSPLPFFLQKNSEGRRTCHGVARRAKTEGFSSLCRQAQLHIFTRRQPLFTQNRRFSSLPRRNAMKPGHLHQAGSKDGVVFLFTALRLHGSKPPWFFSCAVIYYSPEGR